MIRINTKFKNRSCGVLNINNHGKKSYDNNPTTTTAIRKYTNKNARQSQGTQAEHTE